MRAAFLTQLALILYKAGVSNRTFGAFLRQCFPNDDKHLTSEDRANAAYGDELVTTAQSQVGEVNLDTPVGDVLDMIAPLLDPENIHCTSIYILSCVIS